MSETKRETNENQAEKKEMSAIELLDKIVATADSTTFVKAIIEMGVSPRPSTYLAAFKNGNGVNEMMKFVCVAMQCPHDDKTLWTYLCERLRDAHHGDDRQVWNQIDFQIAKDTRQYSRSNVPCNIAAQFESLELFDYLIKRGYPVDVGAVSLTAAQHGHMGTIRHLLNKGFSLSISCATAAAHKGQLEIVQFLVETGRTLGHESNLIQSAVMSKSIPLVKYLAEKQFRLDAHSAEIASRNGDFEMLKCIHSVGCPMDERVVKNALDAKTVHVAVWAMENANIKLSAETVKLLCDAITGMCSK